MAYTQRSSILVPVDQGLPPEELLPSLVGAFGRWQVLIVCVAFLAEYLHGLNVYTSLFIGPSELNYSCKYGNGSKCYNANGSKCKEFVFSKRQYDFITVNEKFNLVCEKEYLVQWLDRAFRGGLLLSYFFIGWFADRFGRRATALIFIPFQCIFGLLTISTDNFIFFAVFRAFYGFTSGSINLLPKITVCDSVGNKWRTFAVGCAIIPLTLGYLSFSYLAMIFHETNGLVATIALLPIMFLFMLLFVRDTPSWMFIKKDVDRAEISLREIAHFNGHTIPNTFKIRPVEILGLKLETYNSFAGICKFGRTRRAFIALTFLWLCEGFCFHLLLIHMYRDHSVTFLKNSFYGGLMGFSGCLVAILFCQFIKHKIIIGCFTVLQLCGVGMTFQLFKKSTTDVVLMINYAAFFLLWVSFCSLDNLTPRMFPTDIRTQSVGFCFSIFHIGSLIGSFALPFFEREIFGPEIALMTVVPIMVGISSFFLWDVRNRELPDYLIDAVNFNRYYKPPRFINIDDKDTSLTEIEVKSIDLENIADLPPVRSRTRRKTLKEMWKEFIDDLNTP